MAAPDAKNKKNKSAETDRQNRTTARSGRVLVIGDDAQSFLAIVRSLGRKGLEVHAAPFDWHAPALKSRFVAATHHLPRIEPDTCAWFEAVQALDATYAYDLIIPCSERSLLPLWQSRSAFAEGVLAYPGDAAMTRLFDKLETRAVAEACHVSVARGRALSETDTGASLVADLGTPLYIKSRQSYTLENLSDRGSVTAVESAQAADAILADITNRDHFLVESGFPASGHGTGLGISVLARNGEILVAFQHRRLREKPGGGASSMRISEPLDPEMFAACKKIALATKLNGVAMFEFRQEKATGDWVLLEVNARFWGSVALAIAAGIDFPAKLYDMMVTGEVDVPDTYQHGARSSNSLQSILHLLGDPEISAFSKPFLVLGEIARRGWSWLCRKEDVDELATDDMVPGLAAHVTAPKRLLDRVRWQSDGGPERRTQGLGITSEERMFADLADDTAQQGKAVPVKASPLARLWGNDSVKTLFARIAGVGVGFALNIVLARALGAAEFGTYAAIWTWVIVLGGLAPLGFTMASTRFLATYMERDNAGHARAFLRVTTGFVGAAALIFAMFMGGAAAMFAPPALVPAALVGAVCIPLFAFTELGKGVARGAGWQLLAYAPGFVLRPVVLFVLALAALALAWPLDAAGALGLTLAASALVVLTQWQMITTRLRGYLGDATPQWDTRNWVRTALPLTLVEGNTLFLSFADIIILQFFVPMDVVGLYYVAAKVAATVAFVHIAVSSAAAKPIAAAFARNDKAAIKALSRRFIAQSFYPTALIAAVLAIFGGSALALFGAEFTAAWPILLVLTFGLVVQAAMGPLKFTLSMTGEQNAVARIVLVSMLANIVLNIILIFAFGAIGAAIATAMVTIGTCVLMLHLAKKRLGFWSIIGA